MFASIIVFAVLSLTFGTVGAENIANSPYEQQDYFCVLPPHPANGTYTVVNYPYATPGERYSSVKLDISCDTGYLNNNTIKSVYCVNGDWSATMPECVQDWSDTACRLTIQHNLESTNHLELPWHAVINKKSSEGYEHICGGSLITHTKILSAARCYYDKYPREELFPVRDFMVAVNKMYNSHNDVRNSQCADVIDIKIQSSYHGVGKSFDNNIAVVVVKTPFIFHFSVRPVCLDFDNNLDRTQLTEGNSGKTVCWNNYISNELMVVDFLYVKNENCIDTPPSPLILTKDKFCTRRNIGVRGYYPNYGTGLVFLEPTSQQYYLRGVASHYSIANGTVMVIYTSIVKHEDFIKQHL